RLELKSLGGNAVSAQRRESGQNEWNETAHSQVADITIPKTRQRSDYSVFLRVADPKTAHTGLPTSTVWPVAASRPVSASILKTTTLSASWFSAKSHLPVESITKWRGVVPCVQV